MSSDASSASSGGLNKADGPLPAADFNKLVMWNNDKQQMVDTDLKTGEMWVFEEYGNTRGNRYCLSATELYELQTILKNSSVCVPTVDFDKAKNQVCTMNYEFPYASLMNEKDEFRLGEKNNGCDEPADLCGDRGPMLKNYIASILAQLSSKPCP